jgi:hypothetical protein
MAESPGIDKGYKHFLRYNQICFDGIEYGFTDFFYEIIESMLFIKKVDNRNNTEKEFEFPLEIKNTRPEIVLEDFLINLMSYKYSFEGEPVYVHSKVFSKESFDNMLRKGVELRKEREESAILLNLNNELIKYCKSIGLNPEPEGSSTSNWQANCPSGGNHYIMISTKSNEWGCGYCKRKGDLNSLKEWYQSKNKII